MLQGGRSLLDPRQGVWHGFGFMITVLINVLKYPAVACLSALVCWVALKGFGRCAVRCGLVDRPRARHAHRGDIPLAGGVAIFVALFVTLPLVYMGPWTGLSGTLNAAWWPKFLAIASAFLCVGLIDDRYDLKPFWKLAGQIVAASVAYALDIRLGKVLGLTLPPGLDLLATVLWYAAFVNAFNLIDGMDGVATGLALVGCAGLSILFALQRQPFSVMVMLVMIGACSTFLFYNFYPAKYFLGDTGSMLLGAFFATVALGASAKSATVASLGFPLLVIGVPLMDSALAIWRRTVRRWTGSGAAGALKDDTSHVMKGDLDHVHHRLARLGHSPVRVALILYGLNAFLVVVGLIMIFYNSAAVGVAFLSFVILVYLVVNHFATLELGITGQALIAGLHRPRSRALAGFLYPLFDACALAFGAMPALFLAGPVLQAETSTRLLWLSNAPALVTLPLAALWLAGIYRRMWSRARVSEYALLAAALLAGLTAAVGVLCMMRDWTLYPSVLLLTLLFSIVSGMIVGMRALPRVVIDLAGWRRRHVAEASACKTVVYGAGYQATLLLRDMTFRTNDERVNEHVVGLIDDDSNTWFRMMHGYRVLGDGERLIGMMRDGSVDKVIVACRIGPDVLQRLLDAAKIGAVRVDRWTCVTQTLSGDRTDFATTQ